MTEVRRADWDEFVANAPASLVTQRDIFHPAVSLQTSPAFILGSLPPALCLPLVSEFGTGPVRLYSVRDACVTLDGVVVSGSTVLSSPMFNHPDYHVDGIVRDLLGGRMSLPIRRVEEQAVMLTGPGYQVYGHWLVDILPRLWLLKLCGFDPARMRYVVAEQSPLFLLPLLATFGIGGHQLITYNERIEMLQVADLIVPTNLRRASRLHASMRSARDYLLERAVEVAPIPPPRANLDRVFVSRRNAEVSRNLVNRARVEAIAVEAGYTLIEPETLTVPEQISLFQNVRQIVGEYGSGLHNALFSPPGTVVCALRGTSAHPGFIQSAISEVCGHRTGYVLTDTPIDAIHQDFAVAEDMFRLALSCTALAAAAGAPQLPHSPTGEMI